MPKTAPAPNRVKSMSDLLATASEPTVADVTNVISAKRLVFIEFKTIRDFVGHAFHLYTGERLNDMVESVRQNGILQPLIVRRIYDDPEFDYEMLSGHNRKNAAVIAGLDGALCLVKEGISDEEAVMYVVETNLMQRSFSDMLPSERAAGLAMRYSEMFSQGKRNDIIRELQQLSGKVLDGTCGTEYHRSRSRDSLGDQYNLTGRAIANYLRLDKLIAPLKVRLDNGELTIKSGVHLSFLLDTEQHLVNESLSSLIGKLSDGKAGEIRKKSEVRELDKPVLEAILKDNPTTRAISFRLPPQTFSRYFKPTTPRAEIEKTIELALAAYFSKE